MLRTKKIILSMAIAFTLAGGLCSTASALGAKEIEIEATAVKVAREVERGGYQLVTTDELKSWMDKKRDMLIVDAMPFADSYKKRRIPGAVNYDFPVNEVTTLDEAAQTAYAKVLGDKRDRLIVVYCGSTKCGRSHNGAMWAVKLGYTNVYRYPGGINAWEEAENPIDKEPK